MRVNETGGTSLHTSVYLEHFNPPLWLREGSASFGENGVSDADALPADPEAEPELPSEETVEVSSLEDLFQAVEHVPRVDAGLGCDGIFVDVTLRRGARLEERRFWSPRATDRPEAFEMLRRVHALAWSRVSKPESRRRLEELHGALDLGAPIERLGGAPPVARMWGLLSVDDATELRALVRELAELGGVLDLSDVTGIAAGLAEVFTHARGNLHVVVRPSQRSLLTTAGIPSTHVHDRRVDALAAAST